jgi:hypothetical protein
MYTNIRMPFLVWIVLIFTLISSIGGRFLEYSIAGLGWLIPLIISILTILQNPRKSQFPIKIWMPWICIVVIYAIFSQFPNSLQRSIMLICPFIVGVAVSKTSIEEQDLKILSKFLRYIGIGFYIIILFKTGIVITGMLPARTGLAAEAMTGTIFCSLFVTNYVFGEKKQLVWWAAFAAIPYIALTRTGMIAAGLTLPLTFAPLQIIKRVFFAAIIIMIAIPLFYSERVQQKMFYSGKGTLEEVNPGNPDFATHGRKAMWAAIQKEIDKEPYFGHGANSSEAFLKVFFGGAAHPHNDWLRLLFDYGHFGTGIFSLSLLMQLIHILKRSKNSDGALRILYYTGASSILSFVLFMFSDNIILYVAFFGNLQFTIIGIAYAAYAQKEKKIVIESRKYRIKW